MTDYQIKHIHIDNQFIMYKMFFWPKHSMSIRFDKKTHSIHVYVNRFISQEQIDVYVKTNISRFYRYLQKYKAGVRIDLNLRYIYLLNEKYQLHVVPTCRRRKYEIFNKNIYLSANSNADRIFLIKKIFSDYCKHFIVPLFQK
jgi:predicted metal-dependent hydrolase